MVGLARVEDIYQMSDFASLQGPSLTGSISLQRSYGATRADLNYTDTKLLSHKVEDGDTLQGLAVKYGVTVEKIKRINKLWSNEGIFLRETIKIPYVAPINKWEDDTDDEDDAEDKCKAQKADIQSKENLEKSEASAISENSFPEAVKSDETDYDEFMCNIDNRINKCKNEWKKKKNQQSSSSHVPCVSYDSNDVNKLSPTKQSGTLLERL